MKWIDLTVTYNKHFWIEKNTVTCGCFEIKMEHHSNTWNCPEKLLSDQYQMNRWLLPLQSKLPDVFSWLRYSLQRNFDSNDTAWQHNLQCALFLCQIYQCNMYKLGKFDLWKNKGQEFFIIFSSSRFIDNIDSDKIYFLLTWKLLSYHFVSIRFFNNGSRKDSCHLIFSLNFFLYKNPNYVTSFKKFK